MMLVIPIAYSQVALADEKPLAGFSLPAEVKEVRFRYQTYLNLIVLPLTINDSIHVNVILDTGCRNLLLFGKRFEKMFEILPGRKIRFSGLGENGPMTGKLSIENKVSIQKLSGENIPVVIVPGKRLFSGSPHIDGIIGYDVFIKFEIEFDASTQMIAFRPGDVAEISPEYTEVTLDIEDSRPLIHSWISLSSPERSACPIMVDTGSALGLLLKSRDAKHFHELAMQVLGKGLGGNVMGTVTRVKKLVLEKVEMADVRAGISWSDWYTHGSIGMEIMKEYSVVLNYCKGYAGFKKLPKRAKPIA
jgi:hypothetical protein